MSRCVIVGGADMENPSAVRAYLRPDDYVIYCDCGLRHRQALGRAPDLIVGDFDSFADPIPAAETIVLPREKDDTDTVFAAKEALRRGFAHFLLVGMVGRRLDHTLGNLALLLLLDKAGATALLVDDYSEMELVSRRPALVSDRFPYFSLLALGGDAQGVTVRHAKYELDHATIPCAYPYGVSNEPLPGQTAQITAAQGNLLLIRVFPSPGR